MGFDRDGTHLRRTATWASLNDGSRARWLKTTAVFNEHGESRQLKLFPSDVKPPSGETDVAQVPVDGSVPLGKGLSG